MADNARDGVVSFLKNLRASSEYSDFVITCKGDTYNVHKAVVCSRSGFFKRAERFAVGKESEEGKVDLPEDDPKTICLLVQYLYEGEYEPKLPDGGCMDEVKEIVYTGKRKGGYNYNFPHTCAYDCGESESKFSICPHHFCGNHCSGDCVDFICKRCCPGAPALRIPPSAEGDVTQLMLHAQMYEIADKYDVTGLKELSREKFLRASAKFWDDELFAPAAHYAFSTTPEDDDGLRGVVSNITSQHMCLLNKPAIEALAREFNGLSFGLLKARAKDLGWIKSG